MLTFPEAAQVRRRLKAKGLTEEEAESLSDAYALLMDRSDLLGQAADFYRKRLRELGELV